MPCKCLSCKAELYIPEAASSGQKLLDLLFLTTFEAEASLLVEI